MTKPTNAASTEVSPEEEELDRQRLEAGERLRKRIVSLHAVADTLETDAIDVRVIAERWEGFLTPKESVLPEEAAQATPPKCSCEWSERPWHDEFLAIESSGPYWAVDLIGYMVHGIENDQVYDMAPNDFESFVSQHNWQDPRQMTWLAIHLEYIFQSGR